MLIHYGQEGFPKKLYQLVDFLATLIPNLLEILIVPGEFPREAGLTSIKHAFTYIYVSLPSFGELSATFQYELFRIFNVSMASISHRRRAFAREETSFLYPRVPTFPLGTYVFRG